MSRTILILPDQIARNNSALMEILKPERDSPPARILMAEAFDLFTGRGIRKSEIVFRLSAYRHFAQELLRRKLTVDHTVLIDGGSGPGESLWGILRTHVSLFAPDEIVVMEPTTAADAASFRSLSEASGTHIRITPNTLFITAGREPRGASIELDQLYRALRAELDILMDQGRPTGGVWSPTDDRISPGGVSALPDLPKFTPDDITKVVMQTVERVFPDYPGSTEEFNLPVTHAQANDLLDFLIQRGHLGAGCYETLAPLLNIGLLNPHHLAKKAETGFTTGKISLKAAEGLIREVLGKREFLFLVERKEHRPPGDAQPD